jgi:MFS family permease
VGEPTRSLFPAHAAAGVAAAAMVATLPGRTHGLGLITEPLLADLRLDKVPFAALNFWATLVGAAFCLPVGWAIDRLGVRVVLAATLAALGAVVVAMAGVHPGGRLVELPAPEVFYVGGVEWAAVPLDLFVLVLLTRGLGQSALSVVSLALVGKAAGKKPGLTIGVYSFLVSLGFMGAFILLGAAFKGGADWRAVWADIGWTLVGFGAAALLVVREPRLPAGPAADEDAPRPGPERSLAVPAALASPAFWVFALATSFYGLVSSGQTLFNESLLAERGLGRDVYLGILKFTPPIGLAANLLTGYLATRVRLGVLLAGGMLVVAGALSAYPLVSTPNEAYAFAGCMAAAGGVVTVLFFAVWRQAFGPAHLGTIQGAAQLLTVIASAFGPLIFAAGQRANGLYAPGMQKLAIVAAVFAVAAVVVPLPRKDSPA